MISQILSNTHLQDTSSVTVLDYMFDGASSFNTPIGSWDVSKVVKMQFTFRDALAFNQTLGESDGA